MLGTVINATAIVIASIAGILLGSRLNEELKESLISALGLAVILIGMSMALETQNVLVVIASMLIGTAIGELIGIEKWLDRGANRIEA